MYEPKSMASVSQDTLLSLQQLDPSPMDSTLELDKELPDLSPPSPSRASTLGLSGSGHGSIFYLNRLQRYSSYVVTVFSTMHIFNTSLIPLLTQSVPASEQYLLLTRPYYQSALAEPLFVAIPLTIHIASGALLRLQRRRAAIRRYGSIPLPAMQIHNKVHARKFSSWPSMTLTSISGYVLTPMVLGHSLINRILPLWVEGSSSGVGLGFVAHGFAKHPFVAYSAFVALICSAAVHFTWGWVKWLNLTPTGDSKRSRRRWWKINASSAILAAIWMAGGLGIVSRAGQTSGWIGKDYDRLYAQIPLLS